MSGCGNKLITETSDNDGHNTDSQNNYHRLVAYIMTIVPYVLHKYIEKEVLKNQSFHEYLDIKKHFLFHLFDTCECCKCKEHNGDKATDRRKLTKEQFSILYEIGKKQNTKCEKTKRCLCVVTANPKVSIQSLDITMISCIFDHDQQSGPFNWINKIKQTRNKVFHLVDPNNINSDQFEYYWKDLHSAVSGIAKWLKDSKLEEKLQNDEKRVMSEIISSSHFVNEITFTQDECKRKNDELQLKLSTQMNEVVQRLNTSHEKNETQHLFTTVASLRSTFDTIEVNVSGDDGVKQLIDMLEKDCYESTVSDMQTVPVLFVMDVPTYWNKDEIAGAVEKLIMSHKEEQRNVRIKSLYTGELNIIVEIVRRVMSRLEELRFEIAQIVSDIVSCSNISAYRCDAINVKLMASLDEKSVPDNKIALPEIDVIMQYDDLEFRKYFRLKKQSYRKILDYLEDKVQNLNYMGVRPQTTLEQQMLLTLWYFVNTESLKDVGDRFGVSEGVAGHIVKHIVWLFLQNSGIHWPKRNALKINEEGFKATLGSPGVVGAIDRTDVQVVTHRHHPISGNRICFHSLVVQLVCDHKMMFMSVNVECRESVYNASAFRTSQVNTENVNWTVLPTGYFLFGNALCFSSMTQFKDKNSKCVQIVTKDIIEQSIAQLKRRFRKLNKLDCSLHNIKDFTKFCCVIHNICMSEEDTL